MPIKSPKAKGATGERELARWLQTNLRLDFLPERNLEQVRSGGADILGVGKFVFECKRCEVVNIDTWWMQVLAASQNYDAHPVLAFRQNRKSWNFVISAKVIGLPRGKIFLDEPTFALYANKRMEEWKSI